MLPLRGEYATCGGVITRAPRRKMCAQRWGATRALSSIEDPPSAPSPPACCLLLWGRVRRPRPPLVFRKA
eukprot:2436239-Prymnesium_polylepis.1